MKSFLIRKTLRPNHDFLTFLEHFILIIFILLILQTSFSCFFVFVLILALIFTILFTLILRIRHSSQLTSDQVLLTSNFRFLTFQFMCQYFAKIIYHQLIRFSYQQITNFFYFMDFFFSLCFKATGPVLTKFPFTSFNCVRLTILHPRCQIHLLINHLAQFCLQIL